MWSGTFLRDLQRGWDFSPVGRPAGAAAAVVAILAAGLGLTILRTYLAFRTPLPLSVDEAQYLDWSRSLAAGYYSKPPMVAWMIAASNLLCTGEPLHGAVNEGCVRMLQPWAWLISACCAFVFAWRVWRDPVIGLVAFGLLLTAPAAAFYAAFATTDAWLMMWWSVAACALAQAVLGRRGQFAAWLLCGAAVGLGLLSKYSMGLFVVGALAWLAGMHRLREPGPWAAAAVALAVFAPNLVWNVANGFATIGHHVELSQAPAGLRIGIGERVASVASFVGAQFLVFSPLVVGMFVLGGWRLAKRRRQAPAGGAGAALLLWLGWPILVLITAQAALSRAYANWALPAGFAVCLLAAHAWRRAGLGRAALALAASLVLNLAVEGLLHAAPAVVAQTRFADDSRRNPFLRLEGWADAVAVLRRVHAFEPAALVAASDRSLLAAIAAYGWPDIRVVHAWNPSGRIDNHYRRFHDLKPALAAAPAGAATPVLLLLEAPRTAASLELLLQFHPEIQQSFQKIMLIDDARTQGLAAILPGGRADRRFQVVRAQFFSG